MGRGHSCHWSLDLAGEDDLEAMKAKNIKQTELVADLREAILRVARHFQCTDPKNCNVVSLRAPRVGRGRGPTPLALSLAVALPPPRQELTPDYSMESHQRDHENYVACSRGHPRRAKALLDFERHDDDELGFRKNDIITVRGERRLPLAEGGVATPSPGRWSRASRAFLWQIVSQKDEHCWVGELNGLRGEASVWSVSRRARGGRARP